MSDITLPRSGPVRDAILHLVNSTALADATMLDGDTIAPCWPFSTGMSLLWQAARSFTEYGHGPSLLECVEKIDAQGVTVLLEALAIAAGMSELPERVAS
jgi:hypothetical protein